MTGMKKYPIDGKLCDVISIEDYIRNRDIYLSGSTLIETAQGIMPLIQPYEKSYGICVGSETSAFSRFNEGTDEEKAKYNPDSMIDLGKASDIGELMQTQEALRDIEKEILTTPDNITSPKIDEDDEPAMKALKQAVIEKHIDIDKYGPRFGANFNNDKRSIFKSRISLQMLERMCRNLDMKATLTITDASEDIANPIGGSISVELTGGAQGDFSTGVH